MAADDVNAALRFFFGTYLQDRQREVLRQRADRAAVRIGAYRRYAGPAVPVTGGETRQPQFAIEVGDVLPMTDGVPQAGAVTVSGDRPKVFLLWLRDVADIALDSRDEIERVMHNLNYFVAEGQRQDAASWAAAIAQHPDRSSLRRRYTEYTEVPAELRSVASDVDAMRNTLYHFFTFTEAGEYYERWNGAGRKVPDDLSTTYRQRNLIELQLERYETYLYGLVPTSFLLADPPDGAARFREVLWGFQWDEGEAQATDVRVLHTIDVDVGDAGDFYDFVAFHAEDGLGVEMPVGARATVDEDLAELLVQLPADGPGRDQVLRRSPIATGAEQPLVPMFATVSGQPTLPDGVRRIDLGGMQLLAAPPEKVVELGALPEITHLRATRPVFPRLADAAAMVDHAALQTLMAADKRGGNGVVVGVIDSGLDAQHPAFAGRVLSVWNQGETAGPSPATNMNAGGGGLMDALEDMTRTFFFGTGTEYAGATAGNARDAGAHGTHVAGIAAGAEVTGSDPVPSGMAPRSTIVAVQSSGSDIRTPDQHSASDLDIVRAVMYIRERARVLKADTPVVINMSFGHHDHAHDGTDSLSRALDLIGKNGKDYVPGLIMVASAGNERALDRHVQRTVAAKGSTTLAFRLGTPLYSPYVEVISIWITNPTKGGTKLAANVRTRKPAPSVVATARVSQKATNTPVTDTFWGEGVHVLTTFGPPDPVNGDFNIRVKFQTAQAVVPDPAGALTIGGSKYTLVRLNQNWTVVGSGADVFTVPGAIVLPLGTPAANAQWQIELRNRSGRAMELHAWAALENARFSGVTPADISHLVLSPADADTVIAVASCNSKLPGGAASDGGNPEGAISSFSNPGPLRKQPTNNGIDITAPGQSIVSARSQDDRDLEAAGNADAIGSKVNTNARRMAGTSMASPLVAGLVANLLAQEPGLTIDKLRTKLANCSIPTKLKDGTALTGPKTAQDWGRGLIKGDKIK